MEDRQPTPSSTQMDADVAAILERAEAGTATVINVVEAAEAHYFGALAATTVVPTIATTNSTW